MKPPQLKTEVQEFKRLRILEEARELFFSQGYEATTLDAIAERLHVTKPFIYSYFKNKSEILNAICHVGISRSLESLDEALASGLPPREMLRLIIEQVTSIVIAHQKYIVVYLREEKNLERKEAKQLMTLRKEFSVRLAKLLEAGTKSGVFDVDDALLTAVSIGGMITWVATWFRPRGLWSQTEVNMHMIKKVERMVLARTPGRGGDE
ncbi:MAG: TetR family transcriptional regulator [Gammaproteobacteria bacterium]|nr:TetR family transcriptional regulator [Gammaproteobacteria bacterium]MDE2349460.1 TetR family transcriptional regulator [Gammaproteobacteria bacterium]